MIICKHFSGLEMKKSYVEKLRELWLIMTSNLSLRQFNILMSFIKME
jgi:hypothetical protein